MAPSECPTKPDRGGSVELSCRAVVLPEHGWVAQCLDWDIACQGSSPEVAISRLSRNLVDNLLLGAKGPILGRPRRAPQPYWTAYRKSVEAGVTHGLTTTPDRGVVVTIEYAIGGL